MHDNLPVITSEMLDWFEITLNERFGLDSKVELIDNYFRIINKKFNFGAIYIGKIDQNFYVLNSHLNCYRWDSSREGFNSILGDHLFAPASLPLNKEIISHDNGIFKIDYDLFGLSYWMLNRLEEINSQDKDVFDRFSAASSHAFRNDYLDRPIVDEWFEILKQVVEKCWPETVFKKNHFKTVVSHDVDRPSMYAFKSWKQIFYQMGSHLKNKRLIEFFKAPLVKILTSQKLSSLDSYNTFSWLMDQSEKNGLKSTFYFISGNTDPVRDADYDLEHPSIQDILKEIHRRGHEIGLHPSFHSYVTMQQVEDEFSKLRLACEKIGIFQKSWSVRMHYLKWRHPLTLNILNDVGFNYDSSLGYHDKPGFRCGTCFEYRAFDPLKNKILNIKVKPLILMESTLIGGVYSKMSNSRDVLETLNYYKEICQKLNGDFVLLWHNSSFLKREYFKIYSKILE